MADYNDMVRLGAAYMAGSPDDEDDGEWCADGYPEHPFTRDTYSGPDGVQWECLRCGAEGWEPAGEGDWGAPT